MADYRAPGVYVEEVPSAVKPIAGVSTSTAGFIGVVEYCEVGLAALRADRKLKETIAAVPAATKDTTLTQNLIMLIQQAQFPDPNKTVQVLEGGQEKDVKLSELTATTMTLNEDIAGVAGATKGTVLTDALITQIKARFPDPNPTVRVEPPVPLVDQQQYSAAQLCTTFSEFTRLFCGFVAGEEAQAQNWLVHAVYGFFNNGGTRCWVTRVAEGTNAAMTNDHLMAALTTFKPIDDIAIVAIPGATDAGVQGALLDHCQDQHLQDRFAILDGQPAPVTLTKEAITQDAQGRSAPNSSYGAIYFPWIQVRDPASRHDIFVPPSGHIAGVYARTDATRGVHKAPANTVIRGALGVQRLLSKEEQAGLNPAGVNVIRQFDGNITLWGARTWANPGTEPEWTYINVRRLFLYLRTSIDQGTQWVVFEPNEPGLWARITRNITAFLTNVWRAGALFGSTPQEAFYVKCDAEINPPEVRDLGQVVTEIGVAVVKPAEFVIFRLSQWTGPGR